MPATNPDRLRVVIYLDKPEERKAKRKAKAGLYKNINRWVAALVKADLAK